MAWVKKTLWCMILLCIPHVHAESVCTSTDSFQLENILDQPEVWQCNMELRIAVWDEMSPENIAQFCHTSVCTNYLSKLVQEPYHIPECQWVDMADQGIIDTIQYLKETCFGSNKFTTGAAIECSDADDLFLQRAIIKLTEMPFCSEAMNTMGATDIKSFCQIIPCVEGVERMLKSLPQCKWKTSSSKALVTEFIALLAECG